MKKALVLVVVVWTLQGRGLWDVGVWVAATLFVGRIASWRG